MKMSTERLAERLSIALGADSIATEAAQRGDHRIDGVEPALICIPATAEQLVAAVRICGELSAATAPYGGGTATSIGNPPRAYDIAIKTTRLNRVIEHDHANLTATVQSGITLNALQSALLPQKQFIPLDPPLPERTSLGGIVAANLNGPRRGRYGSVRDLVIGMKVVLASGETIKAGGKVVKNVAGYDMCKLFTGSLGTLGIITEITSRVAPVPAHSSTIIATGTLAKAFECARTLVRTKLLPTAIYLLNDDASASWRLTVSFDGFAESVARQTNELIEMAQQHGLSHEVIGGEKQRHYWQIIADLPVNPERLVYRVTVPRGALLQTISMFIDRTKSSPTPAICVDVMMGTLWLVVPANQDSVCLFPHLITWAQQQRGHAVMFAAPAALKTADVWGPTTPAHFLMRKIKQEFDPMGLFNPGRYVGGL